MPCVSRLKGKQKNEWLDFMPSSGRLKERPVFLRISETFEAEFVLISTIKIYRFHLFCTNISLF